MTDPKAELIAKFLAGDADIAEVRQLDQAIAEDPSVADALVSEAYLDVHLRETLSGSVLGNLARESQPKDVVVRRSWMFRMAAATLVVAISGWSVAAYVTRELSKARTDNGALSLRIAELEQPAIPPRDTVVPENVPRIYSMRGWLMTARPNGEGKPETQLLQVGTAAPVDQWLQTCPWGATEFRYDAEVSIAVERNSVVRFNEMKNQRRLALERGVVHVTNLSKTDKRPTVIQCTLAMVQVIRGQVAVQVEEHRTIVEAAVNAATVRVEEEGAVRSFRVRQGQYLIIEPGRETSVMRGMLRLGLEPPDK